MRRFEITELSDLGTVHKNPSWWGEGGYAHLTVLYQKHGEVTLLIPYEQIC